MINKSIVKKTTAYCIWPSLPKYSDSTRNLNTEKKTQKSFLRYKIGYTVLEEIILQCSSSRSKEKITLSPLLLRNNTYFQVECMFSELLPLNHNYHNSHFVEIVSRMETRSQVAFCCKSCYGYFPVHASENHCL